MKCILRGMAVLTLTALLAVFLTACSDGGDSDDNSDGGNATITGTVVGTIAVAVDGSGSEVDRDTASGSPKTFTLSVPGGDYRFYLVENEGTTNERVYPLYQGTTNVFTISSAVTINLGSLDTSSGVAVPENDPLSVSGVTSGGEDTSIPPCLSSTGFVLSDLQGIWYGHSLAVGDASQWTGWGYVTVTFDINGNATFTSYLNSDGDSTLLDPETFSISTSGVITNENDPLSTLHGVMSQDKNMIVLTTGDEIDELVIFQRSGGTFSTSDLQGTWKLHTLISPPSLDSGGWTYGTVTLDNNGSGTVTEHESLGGTVNDPISFSINTSGIVTIDGAPLTDGRLVMSQDKNTIAGVVDHDPGSYALIIMQRSGGTFSINDLQGIWNGHLLVSGDSTQRTGWAYFETNIDNSGNLTWTSITRSDGDSSLPSSDTLSITLSGTVSSAESLSFNAVMCQDKSMIVATTDDDDGGYNLTIYQK